MGAIATAIQKPEKAEQEVPDYLVYEVVRGTPIYYKGYRDVLNGTKTREEIKIESTLQSWLKVHLGTLILSKLLIKGYDATAGEMGVNLSKDDKRGADIAIFKEENLILHPRFSDLPPEIVIEIDVKAEVEGMAEMDYIQEKSQDYFGFGVKKVIWIFTRSRSVTVATPQKPWLTFGWETDIELVEGETFNLDELTAKRRIVR